MVKSLKVLNLNIVQTVYKRVSAQMVFATMDWIVGQQGRKG